MSPPRLDRPEAGLSCIDASVHCALPPNVAVVQPSRSELSCAQKASTIAHDCSEDLQLIRGCGVQGWKVS